MRLVYTGRLADHVAGAATDVSVDPIPRKQAVGPSDLLPRISGRDQAALKYSMRAALLPSAWR
jgi:hypothetical protein